MHASTSSRATPAAMNRRDFMRLSAAGGAVLSLAGAAATLTGCSRDAAKAAGFKVLRPQDVVLAGKLLPAALAGALPSEAAARAAATGQALASFDQLLYDTSPAVRTIFLQLLDLLDLGITRGPLFGLWTSWESASHEDAEAVLAGMANSRIGFLRGAYNGLATMAMMSWYLEPAHQSVTRYPGPPKKIVS
jgi:hypothetical protein